MGSARRVHSHMDFEADCHGEEVPELKGIGLYSIEVYLQGLSNVDLQSEHSEFVLCSLKYFLVNMLRYYRQLIYIQIPQAQTANV